VKDSVGTGRRRKAIAFWIFLATVWVLQVNWLNITLSYRKILDPMREKQVLVLVELFDRRGMKA
jgi:hypothetical protein